MNYPKKLPTIKSCSKNFDKKSVIIEDILYKLKLDKGYYSILDKSNKDHLDDTLVNLGLKNTNKNEKIDILVIRNLKKDYQKEISEYIPKLICIKDGLYKYPADYSDRKKLLGNSLAYYSQILNKIGYSVVAFSDYIFAVANDLKSKFELADDVSKIYELGLTTYTLQELRAIKTKLEKNQYVNRIINDYVKSYSPIHHHFTFKPNTQQRHLLQFKKYNILIKTVDTQDLFARVVISNKGVPRHKIKHISKTPHAAFLSGRKKEYSAYLKEFGKSVGYRYGHSVEDFKKLDQNFVRYLDSSHSDEYIICEYTKNFLKERIVILDGVHRATLLVSRSIKSIPVAIVIKPDEKHLSQLHQYFEDYWRDFKEWYTPLKLSDIIIHERTYPKYIPRPEYMNNKERGLSKWNYIIKNNLPNLKGKVVYDIGCNIGLYPILMADLGAKSVTGYDRGPSIFQPTNKELPNQNVVEQAYFVKNLFRLSSKKDYKNVKYIEEDLSKMDYLKIKCDLFFSSCVIYHFGKKKFEEIIEALSKNVKEIFLQTNLGHLNNPELGDIVSVNYQTSILIKNGYKIKAVEPKGYNYPIIYGYKDILRGS